MKRKVLSILICLVVSSLVIVSCAGGTAIYSIPLITRVYIEDVSDEELTSLEAYPYEIYNGKEEEGIAVEHLSKDNDGRYYFSIWYGLGDTRSKKVAKKIVASYKEKMKNFSFVIKDKSGKYEEYKMRLDETKYDVIRENVPEIKYTIKLTKKVGQNLKSTSE